MQSEKDQEIQQFIDRSKRDLSMISQQIAGIRSDVFTQLANLEAQIDSLQQQLSSITRPSPSDSPVNTQQTPPQESPPSEEIDREFRPAGTPGSLPPALMVALTYENRRSFLELVKHKAYRRRLFSWFGLCGLLIYNLFINVFLIIREHKQSSKIFPGR